MTQYILAQDFGNVSCKAILCTLEGDIVRNNIIQYNLCSGDDHRIWQSPDVWWNAFRKNCSILLSGLNPEDVVAISLCAVMMGCLPVSDKGIPLCDAILWEDRRSMQQTERLVSKLDAERLYKISGIRSSPNFSVTKMMWIHDNQQEIYQNTYKFIQAKDYINYKLTGQLVTDVSDAGFTQVYDIYKNCWSEEILAAAEIDVNKMPEVVPQGTVLGKVTQEASRECGLSTHTLVVQGVGDGRAMIIGSGVNRPGEGCIYLGGAAWLSQVTSAQNMDPDCRLTKTSYLYPDLYTNGGAMLAGGLCVDWFLKEFFPEIEPGIHHPLKSTYQFIDHQIERSKVGSNGLLFMPYLTGERSPWWNAEARGGFLGLRSSHTKFDFCRSILEGVSFNLGIIKNSIELLEPFTKIRMVGEWCNPQWQQIIADVFDQTIVSTNISWDSACVGVATLAGIGAGVYEDITEIKRFHKTRHTTIPISENVEIYNELLPAFEDCYHALKDVNQHLGYLFSGEKQSPPDKLRGDFA